MDVNLREISELLQLSEQEIEECISIDDLPCYDVLGQRHFSVPEVEAWLLQRPHRTLRQERMVNGLRRFALSRALFQGVFCETHENNCGAVLKAACTELAKKHALDPDVMAELLIRRERLYSTAIGYGVAIPHVRDFFLGKDMIAFVKNTPPIPMNAPDGQPVSYFFILFAKDQAQHLHLLSKIAYLVQQPNLFASFLKEPSFEAMIDAVKRWESGSSISV